MKTFDERMASIREKSVFEKKKIRNRRIAAGTLAGVFTIALVLVLFIPYSTALPDVSRYASSPYYSVIRGLNKATYQAPRYKNNFEMVASALSNIFGGKNSILEGNFVTNGVPMPGGDGGFTYGDALLDAPQAGPDKNESAGNYEEVTDNQVDGVIEADLFKRSDKHIYYLCGNDFYIYTIDKDDSKCVGNRRIGFSANGAFFDAREMFLSADCSTVTVVMSGYSKENGAMVCLITLDVTDPAHIRKTGTVCFSGSYVSSRLVGDDILLTCNYGVYKSDIDFDKPETYIPKYGDLDNMQLMEGEDIICPDDVSSTRYTIVTKVNSMNLEVKGIKALMGYSREIYVSADMIYATHSYNDTVDVGINTYQSTAMTEITGISYTGDTLDVLGSVKIEGSVKDQYSMDQHNGILRVAASTVETKNESHQLDYVSWSELLERKRNCSLYCIDLTSWEVVASVEKFAPDGDEVTAARFDGDLAYICTAEVIVLTDPVYFFDLSDLSNITWTDTGIIDGYSSSLVNFGDYLLGIGFGENRGLKLEAYVEGSNGVESIGSYERRCNYPDKYKAYFIDRERNLVGIPVYDWNESAKGNMFYLLLQFDGYEFREVACVNIDHYGSDKVRATIIDGWLYVLYNNDLVTLQVW